MAEYFTARSIRTGSSTNIRVERDDRAKDVLFDVAHTADIIDDLFFCGIVVQRVERKIAPLYVFVHRTEFVSDGTVDSRTKCAHFKNLRSEYDVYEPEAAPDNARISENSFDAIRRRIGDDVEIFRNVSDNEIAHRPSDDVRAETRAAQPLDYLERVGVDFIF